MSLQEENRVLQGELARLEDLLAHSRADRDELAIKYGAISERVSEARHRGNDEQQLMARWSRQSRNSDLRIVQKERNTRYDCEKHQVSWFPHMTDLVFHLHSLYKKQNCKTFKTLKVMYT